MVKPYKTVDTTVRRLRVKINIFSYPAGDQPLYESRASCPVCYTTILSSRRKTPSQSEKLIKTNLESHLRRKHL